ncbi:MAG: zinc-binding dehydrogenase [Acidimicrobiia bacterium]|nr:zinc-binding dehydrogenase [Acidimicrobiia bacterium]
MAIGIEAPGGPEQLTTLNKPARSADPGEISVRIEAAGVNFVDTYHRIGLYPLDLPVVLGMEGAGTVDEVGDGVDGVEVGDRVAWSGALGSYADRITMSADTVVPVPEDVSTEIAAALMLQGLTAHYLVNSTYPVQEGDRVLIHAGAGGVGGLAIQLAVRAGAEVFTTVGTAEKEEIASSAGAHHVIRYDQTDFAEEITKIAGPRPLAVVYDGVGATTFDGSISTLRPRGMMVTFGNASGPVEPVSPLVLSQNGSLFLTRPTLASYTATKEELRYRADELFVLVGSGDLAVRIGRTFPLDEAADAHRALEGRQTTGKVLLLP